MGHLGLCGCGGCFKIVWWWQRRLCYSETLGANRTDGIVCHRRCAKNKELLKEVQGEGK